MGKSFGFHADMMMRRSYGFSLSARTTYSHAAAVKRVGSRAPPGPLERAGGLRDLVDSLAGVVGVHVGVLGAKVAPLPAVHGPEVAHLTLGQADRVEVVARRVAVPNLDALVLRGEGGSEAEREAVARSEAAAGGWKAAG